MDIITSLMQMFGNCAGSTSQAAQATADAAGGFSGLITMLCKLLGIGC